MSAEPNIKILVSCHKRVCLPQSDLFLPVHVGAQGKAALSGMQPDNEGDNISDRNFTFCEMSGQYWAWKNLEADYVGQCHYRRFFSFGHNPGKANDHGQIESSCLCPDSISQYGIDDEEAIRSVVCAHDMVRAPYWSVRGVPTPDGPKGTIRDHMVAYGLVSGDSIDRLVEICKRLQPDYADDLVSYLNGDKYLGYNCFIMKRELFDRLCEFEFSVLREFDSQFDYSDLTTTQKRICGYLGEVLYSAFVAHVVKEGASVAEVPLVFFEGTPAPSKLRVSGDGINIFWRYVCGSAAELAVSVESLAKVADPSHLYFVTIIHDCNFRDMELSSFLSTLPENIVLSCVAIECIDHPSSLSGWESRVILPLLMPYIADGISCSSAPLIWVEGCGLFLEDPVSLIVDSNGAVGKASEGLFLHKELNKPYNRDLRKCYLLDNGSSDALDFSLALIDVSPSIGLDELINEYRLVCKNLDCDPSVLLRDAVKAHFKLKEKPGNTKESLWLPIEMEAVRSLLLFRLGYSRFSLEQSFPVVEPEEVSGWARESLAIEWKHAKPRVFLRFTAGRLPLFDPSDDCCAMYWAGARRTRAYESLLMALVEQRPFSLKDRVLPPNSFMRRALGKAKRMAFR